MFPALVIGVGIAGFIALLLIFVRYYIKVPPNLALILTGRKYRTVVREGGKDRAVVRGWKAVVGGAIFRIDRKSVV